MSEELNSASALHEHVESFAPQAFPRSDFDHALLAYLALNARHGVDGMRDGRRAAMVAVFNGRATWDAIRQWRRGVARAPQWAWDMLDKKMAARQNELAHGQQFIRRSA